MSAELKEGVVIASRFRLVRQIGQGGMGSVWLAENTSLDVPCAIKFIHGEHAKSPELRARFEREAKAAAQLRSPHVVQVLDNGVWEDLPFIVMELLEGEDLQTRLLRVGRIHPREVSSIIGQVSRALSKAHGAGLVHRDLKPANIFLVRDDDREIAKVLDFGVAKVNTGSLSDSNTKTGAVLGTPFYMSPEQGQGTRVVDHRSDLWSLAVVAYQCLTGQLPFVSEAFGDLLMKVMIGPIPVPSNVAPGVPLGFDIWWARASQRDPAYRFQNAKEFADALMMALGVSAGPAIDLSSQSLPRAAAPAQPGSWPNAAPPQAPWSHQAVPTAQSPFTGGSAQPAHPAPGPGAYAAQAVYPPSPQATPIPGRASVTAYAMPIQTASPVVAGPSVQPPPAGSAVVFWLAGALVIAAVGLGVWVFGASHHAPPAAASGDAAKSRVGSTTPPSTSAPSAASSSLSNREGASSAVAASASVATAEPSASPLEHEDVSSALVPGQTASAPRPVPSSTSTLPLPKKKHDFGI